jgi:hypothetical protein
VGIYRDAADRQVLDFVALERLEDPHRVERAAVELGGKVIESSAVAGDARGAERGLAEEIAYWAPAGSKGLEVDFVLRRGAELCALEVKAGRRGQAGQLKGLRAIAELPGLRRRVLVHRGDRPTRTEDGIDLWPVETFLQALEQGRLWPESAD